jgi:cob(I)alamin adenosyltransferase
VTDRPPTDAPDFPNRSAARSVVIVNTGDGKGKTTAAIGVLVRAIARGWRVAVIQFVKSGDWKVGEEQIATRLGADWWTLGEGFTWDSGDLDVDTATARAAWDAAKSRIGSADYDLVVLDEITYPINWGWIDGNDVAATIRDRPPAVNVIVTGRDAPAALVEIADTVTEMVKVRHAYDRGVRARRGIEY